MQAKSQAVPLQVGVALAGAVQVAQRSPQESTLRLSLQTPSQSWNPLRQVYRHSLFTQATVAFERVPQGAQAAPQKLTLFTGTQDPLQSRWPFGHIPSQACPAGMQAPLQIWVPEGHSVPHLVPSQVALPPSGIGQAVQEEPQLVGLELSRQRSSHRWKPGRQARSQVSPLQVVSPFGSVGQGVQEDPQAVRLVGATQSPLHRFFPPGQVLSQGSPSGMHLSRQGFCMGGQETLHLVPSQVAMPPAIVGHAWQETPQVSGDVLLTQPEGQRCSPAGHSTSGAGGPAGGGSGPSVAGVVPPGPSGVAGEVPPEPPVPPVPRPPVMPPPGGFTTGVGSFLAFKQASAASALTAIKQRRGAVETSLIDEDAPGLVELSECGMTLLDVRACSRRDLSALRDIVVGST